MIRSDFFKLLSGTAIYASLTGFIKPKTSVNFCDGDFAKLGIARDYRSDKVLVKFRYSVGRMKDSTGIDYKVFTTHLDDKGHIVASEQPPGTEAEMLFEVEAESPMGEILGNIIDTVAESDPSQRYSYLEFDLAEIMQR